MSIKQIDGDDLMVAQQRASSFDLGIFQDYYGDPGNVTVHITHTGYPVGLVLPEHNNMDDFSQRENSVLLTKHGYLHNDDGYSLETEYTIEDNRQLGIDLPESLPVPIALTLLISGSLIFTFGVFGNLMIMTAVLISRRLRRPYNVFIFSFALTDLTILLAVGVFQLHTCHVGVWVFDKHMCLYLSTMLSCQLILSGMHIIAISFYRYVTIVHPGWSGVLKKRKTIIFILVSMYVITFANFPLARIIRIYILNEDLLTDTVFDYRSMSCIVERLYRTNMIGFVIIVAIGSVLLVYFYARIHHLVRVNEIKLLKHANTTKKRNISGDKKKSSTERHRKDMKILKTMSIIFLMYIGGQLPLPLLLHIDKDRSFPHIWYAPWVLFLWISSSTNWVIYGLLNRDFKQAYKQIFLCELRNSAHDVNDSSYKVPGRNNDNHIPLVSRPSHLNQVQDDHNSIIDANQYDQSSPKQIQ